MFTAAAVVWIAGALVACLTISAAAVAAEIEKQSGDGRTYATKRTEIQAGDGVSTPEHRDPGADAGKVAAGVRPVRAGDGQGPFLQFSILCLNVEQPEQRPPSLEHVFYEMPFPEFPFRFPEGEGFYICNGWCNGVGPHVQQMKILDPARQTVLIDTGDQPFTLKIREEPFMAVNSITGMSFDAPGTYWIQVFLDDQLRLEYPLPIRRLEKRQSSPAVAVEEDPGIEIRGLQIGDQVTVSVTGRTGGPVWGDAVYTVDSDVDTAAVHAGIVQVGETRQVRVRVVPPPPHFNASKKHGVQTAEWGAFRAAMTLEPAAARPAGAAPQSPPPGRRVKVEDLEIGESRTVMITGRDQGIVWGTDVYTGDSRFEIAAVHAGALGPGQTGEVVITRVSPLDRYEGSTRHGVRSGDWASYPTAYTIKPTASAPREGTPVQNSIGMSLVRIEAGEFDMGSNVGDTERPVHRVRITKPFLMGQTEVTRGQYERVTGASPRLVFEVGDNVAVSLVSWDEAVEFCRKLTEIDRRAGRLAVGRAYRLPTEAEWEYACRAGTTTKWSFGDNDSRAGDYGWVQERGAGKDERHAHAVGLKKPNPWNLFDMHGNVWEWCSDWHADDYYGQSPAADPKGPSSEPVRLTDSGVRVPAFRVTRGGSYFDGPDDCRSASRNSDAPGLRQLSVGFRVVREVE